MRKNSLFLLMVLCITFSLLEEAASQLRQGWRRKDRAVQLARQLVRQGARVRSERRHTVIIAVRQLNVDTLEQRVQEISDPKHPAYGRYLTFQEVGKWIQNEEGTARVTAYLRRLGSDVSVKTTWHGEYLSVTAPVSIWESVLNTEFHEYHRPNGKVVVGAEEYSLPDELFDVVDAVFNVCDIEPPPVTHLKFQPLSEPMPASFLSSSAGSMKAQGDPIVALATTDGNVRPSLISSYYNIANSTGGMLSTQAVYATIGQTMSPSDLSTFQSSFGLPIQSISANIGGHVDDNACGSSLSNCVEANLDVQYMMSTGQNINTTFYYSDLSWASWATEVADMTDPPRVISISYGSDERFMSSSSKSSFNTQAIRLAAMGVTLVAASGDDGAMGYNYDSGAITSCGYYPSFPASNPYVLAVGATMGPESGKAEIQCSSKNGSLITGGGGFSAFFSRPSYQNDAVSGWSASLTQSPTSGYNTNGRGFPDISLLGNRYLVVLSGAKYYIVSGTSASAPVFGGMLALVNWRRKEMGLSEVGWINPAIYSLYSTFVRDVTEGDNKCTSSKKCCSQGFQATVGWDPVTGFGSLDFEAFLAAFTTTTSSPSSSPVPLPTESPDSTRSPSATPSTVSPSLAPSRTPSTAPSRSPSAPPSMPPSLAPSTAPSKLPTYLPSRLPTASPSLSPSFVPSVFPSEVPSESPSGAPSENPSAAPSDSPTISPTVSPTLSPSTTPTKPPSREPSYSPTFTPTVAPSVLPTSTPVSLPTENPVLLLPSSTPSKMPLQTPTETPSQSPTETPSRSPTVVPSRSPTVVPSRSPTVDPSRAPTEIPTRPPSRRPSASPTTSAPSLNLQPTRQPTESSGQPSAVMPPTMSPTLEPIIELRLSVQYSLSDVNVSSLTDPAVLAEMDQIMIESTCSSLSLPTSCCFCIDSCLRLPATSSARFQRRLSESTVQAFVNVSAPYEMFDDGETTPEMALAQISTSVTSINTSSILTALIQVDSLAFGSSSIPSPAVSSSSVESIPQSAAPTLSPVASPSSFTVFGLSETVFIAVVAGVGGVLVICLVAVIVACSSGSCARGSSRAAAYSPRANGFNNNFISDHDAAPSIMLEFEEEGTSTAVCPAQQLSV